MVKKYSGYFTEEGRLIADKKEVRLPPNRWAIIHVLGDGVTGDEDIPTPITTVTFEIEELLYLEAERVLGKNGMDMTCAINLFLRSVVQDENILHELRAEDERAAADYQAFIKAELDKSKIKAADPNTKTYSSEEVFSSLDKILAERTAISQKFDDDWRELFTKKLRENTKFGYDLWAALANIQWTHDDDPNKNGCGPISFRRAASFVSSMLCYEIDQLECLEHTDAGVVSDEIASAMASRGWRYELV